MLFCPKCGHRAKHGEYCPDCGIRLQEMSSGTKTQKGAGKSTPAPAPTPVSAPPLSGIKWDSPTVIFALIVAGLMFITFLVFAFSVSAKILTKLELTGPQHVVVNESTSLSIRLTDIDGNPVANRSIIISGNGVDLGAITNSQGKGEAITTFTETGVKKIKANFVGDKTYNSTESQEITISVTLGLCNDGTVVGQCSKKKEFYCDEDKKLKKYCSKCGCPEKMACIYESCVSEELRVGYLIEELQKSVVFVKHSYATGSGVIIAHADGETYILTNRHVIKDAPDVEDVKVTVYGGQTIPAREIRIAPYEMDLAIIRVLGIYGQPVIVNASESYYRGEEVVALGSPLGISGSVSNGIISNFLYDTTKTEYKYNIIQTDAAINPGNSGGGLFLKSNGHLIGINAFLLASDYGAEGLGFAIDVRSIDNLPPPGKWEQFEPAPRCSDGTPYGYCSDKKGYYCSESGTLYEDCNQCGCSVGYFCPNNGKCFTCPAGYSPFQTKAGAGFCCPTGWRFYDDGASERFCCPPGTRGYIGGYCE